ncbi:MAG: tRNA (adenosine(37)-N6)-threonylcarbamoyltransferase complex dimerization subunit type 1 TsaB [Microbacterium sp.]|uniref:tRNA (adenosine(37)-N6)-threonylcarbamoyltransferase complex dimerization subunit type 1 TsaB n=1 Tax=Microbacterium sp. TaxID=51671 RepID=UPI003A848F98
MLLAIDTSLGTAAAVVEPDGVVRSEVESLDPRGHAEAVGTLISHALAEASITPADVTHVAVGMGPGPFTGLRVGIAAARAFALGRAVPVVPVVSHDAAALTRLLGDALRGVDTPRFAVVTDARRREAAYTVYDDLDAAGLPVRTAEPALALRDEIDDRLTGVGAERREATRVSAAMLGIVAARAVAADRRVGPDDALYLRSPDVTPPGPRKVLL